ncbi:RodZ domain-containing protein [Ideonella sp. DXS29W]|uniref:RodZ domain-containing protein n=1 Tax=Ideonella lacteola TaxID=2984193 RepID=A0ABU9C0C7_9BURK
MLRAARQAQGLHVAALATMLKVPPRKLEALEDDRLEEFQGATFVRALAQAACRALKIDPAPVLDKLPELDNGALSQLERGLNTPFREKGARRDAPDLPIASRTVVVVVALLLLGALAFLFWPADWRWQGWRDSSSSAMPAGDAPVHVSAPMASAEVAASSVAATSTADQNGASVTAPSTGIPNLAHGTGVAASAPSALPMPAAMPRPAASSPLSVAQAAPTGLAAPSSGALQTSPAASAAAGSGVLRLQARAASWVEVVDGRSQVLLSRTLAVGETVGLDGALPLRVKIGNAAGTDVTFRGRPVDLGALHRDNVAKFELK